MKILGIDGFIGKNEGALHAPTPYLFLSLSSCFFPSFHPETAWIYPVTLLRCSTLSLSQLGHSSSRPDATWKSSMHTVMSFVKAKYPTCGCFAMFFPTSF